MQALRNGRAQVSFSAMSASAIVLSDPPLTRIESSPVNTKWRSWAQLSNAAMSSGAYSRLAASRIDARRFRADGSRRKVPSASALKAQSQSGALSSPSSPSTWKGARVLWTVN